MDKSRQQSCQGNSLGKGKKGAVLTIYLHNEVSVFFPESAFTYIFKCLPFQRIETQHPYPHTLKSLPVAHLGSLRKQSSGFPGASQNLSIQKGSALPPRKPWASPSPGRALADVPQGENQGPQINGLRCPARLNRSYSSQFCLVSDNRPASSARLLVTNSDIKLEHKTLKTFFQKIVVVVFKSSLLWVPLWIVRLALGT